MRPAQVHCYSGRAYAERPVFFTVEGVTYSVHCVDREWREPGTKHFLVCTGDDQHVELCYNDQDHEWTACDRGEKETG